VADEVTTIRDGVSSPGTSTRRARTQSREPQAAVQPAQPPAFTVSGVSMTYGRTARLRRSGPEVLRDVSLSAAVGTTAGLVGRSGSGKTTLAQIVAGILKPTEGEVMIDGVAMTDGVNRIEKAGLVQYVFQDPFGSLNPRRTALAQVAEPLIAAGVTQHDANDQARFMLADVGLTPAQIGRRSRELSGGQCQRVGVARALIRRPRLVILDEPVSALDWSIRAEILAILAELQSATGATYLLIAHERPLIEQQCDAIYEVADNTVRRI